MKHVFLISASLALTMCTRPTEQENTAKIVNGSDVRRSDYTRIAKLTVPGGICTASKISPTLWLTAAHCVLGVKDNLQGTYLTLSEGPALFAINIFLPQGYQVLKDGTEVDVEHDVAIIETTETTGDYYKIGPFQDGAISTILGFGVASNCKKLKAEGSELAPNCAVTFKNSIGGTLRKATVQDTQINSVTNDVVTFIGPIAPDESELAGPGFGDSGGPMIQGDSIVATLLGAQFRDIKTHGQDLAIAESNRLLAIYVHSQTPAFCDVIRAAERSGPIDVSQVDSCDVGANTDAGDSATSKSINIETPINTASSEIPCDPTNSVATTCSDASTIPKIEVRREKTCQTSDGSTTSCPQTQPTQIKYTVATGRDVRARSTSNGTDGIGYTGSAVVIWPITAKGNPEGGFDASAGQEAFRKDQQNQAAIEAAQAAANNKVESVIYKP